MEEPRPIRIIRILTTHSFLDNVLPEVSSAIHRLLVRDLGTHPPHVAWWTASWMETRGEPTTDLLATGPDGVSAISQLKLLNYICSIGVPEFTPPESCQQYTLVLASSKVLADLPGDRNHYYCPGRTNYPSRSAIVSAGWILPGAGMANHRSIAMIAVHELAHLLLPENPSGKTHCARKTCLLEPGSNDSRVIHERCQGIFDRNDEFLLCDACRESFRTGDGSHLTEE